MIGFDSILHMGISQIKMAEPIRICQGKKMEIKVKGRQAQYIQFDGEPFKLKGNIDISIKSYDKINMLVN